MVSIKKLKNYFLVGADKVRHQVQTDLFLRTGYFAPHPLKVYYLMTNKCNFQCKMCPQWQTGIGEDIGEYIPTERMMSIIDEMSALGMKEFGISGGEALIFREKLFSLLAHANKRGMLTHFVTNGLLLTKEILDEYDRIGGGYVSLSIDAIGDKHSELRGNPLAFAGVEKVLDIFAKNKFRNINLKINVVITNDNIEESVAVMRRAVEIGAMAFIQPYDHCDYACDKDSVASRYPLWVQPENFERLELVVAELLELKKNHPKHILNDPDHIKAMSGYFRNKKIYRPCFALLDQITIDPFGKVIACIFNDYGDLRKSSLKSFLVSKRRRQVIVQSLRCQVGCLLGCMFRPSFREMLLNGPRQLWQLAKK